MMTLNREKKRRIISAGYKAVDELIKIAEEEIIKPNPEDELAADRLKNAAILDKIEEEKNKIDSIVTIDKKIDTNQGFAERRSK